MRRVMSAVSVLTLVLCGVARSAHAAPDGTDPVSISPEVILEKEAETALWTALDDELPGDTLVRRGSPPAPELVSPEDGAALHEGDVAFRWRDGEGGVRAEWFRVCVFERGSSCTQGVEYPLAGEPDLTVPFYEPAGGLPLGLQGKRLIWRVQACAHDPDGLTLAGSALPVICASAGRSLDWTRPAARSIEIQDPRPGGSSLIRVSWQHGVPSDTSYILVCMAEPDAACGSRYSKVTRFDDPTRTEGLVSMDTWEHHEGTRVEWSVALCTAWDDCVWSDRAPYTFPYRPRSFGHLLPVVRTPECENCHTFRSGNVVYDRHVALRRFSEDADQSAAATCEGCHNPATGYPSGWRAPAGWRFGVRPLECKSIRDHLEEARRQNATQYGSTAPDPALAHLRDDPLVEWAVGRSGVVSQAEWDDMVEQWVTTDMQCVREHNSLWRHEQQMHPWLYDIFTLSPL